MPGMQLKKRVIGLQCCFFSTPGIYRYLRQSRHRNEGVVPLYRKLGKGNCMRQRSITEKSGLGPVDHYSYNYSYMQSYLIMLSCMLQPKNSHNFAPIFISGIIILI